MACSSHSCEGLGEVATEVVGLFEADGEPVKSADALKAEASVCWGDDAAKEPPKETASTDVKPKKKAEAKKKPKKN